MKELTKQEDPYSKYQGKAVYMPGEPTLMGFVQEVNLGDQLFRLTGVPHYDAVEHKLIKREVLVPFGSRIIIEIGSKELERAAADYEVQSQYLGEFVRIDKYAGKLIDITWNRYTLKPSIVDVSGKLRWEQRLPLYVPRDSAAIIIPSAESELEELICNSARGNEIAKLDAELRIKHMKKELEKKDLEGGAPASS